MSTVTLFLPVNPPSNRDMITDLRTFPIGYITGLLNKLTWEFEQKYPYDHEGVNIYLPKILFTVLEHDYRDRCSNVPITLKTYRGYNLLPGYEYGKIIIAHERYPETNDSRYFHFIDVVESVELKDRPKGSSLPPQ